MRGSGLIACIFDFDETLVPDSTTSLLEGRGVDSKEFWAESRKLAERGYEPTLAWLRLFLDRVGEGRPLGHLSNADLRAHGTTLDDSLFPGLDTLFDDLRSLVSNVRDVSIEFYIVSGGLREVVLGSELVRANFQNVYGCELDEDESGDVRHIKRCVSFTDKTRCIFEINKGIPPDQAAREPYAVNRSVAPDDRRVPLENMIYVGDGLTDIPCFSVVSAGNGTALGVFDPSEESKAKRALTEFLQPHRVLSMHRPQYRADDELGAILRAAVAAKAATIGLQRSEAYGR